MPTIEAGIQNGCVILPFVSPHSRSEDIKSTSLAALVAVTILHDAKKCPEERLIEILEQTGEVEVMDTDEALSDLGLEELDTPTGYQLSSPSNDNDLLKSI